MEQRADFCSDVPEKASVDFNQQGLELVEKCLEIFKKKKQTTREGRETGRAEKKDTSAWECFSLDDSRFTDGEP